MHGGGREKWDFFIIFNKIKNLWIKRKKIKFEGKDKRNLSDEWRNQGGEWVKIYPPSLEKMVETEKLFKIARVFSISKNFYLRRCFLVYTYP